MRSFGARLNLIFVLPTAVIVVVLVAVAYGAARQGLEDELSRRLVEVSQVMAVDLSEGVDAAQIQRLDESMIRVHGRLQQRLKRIRDATDVQRIFIFDRDSGSLVDTEVETGFGETLYRIQADRQEVERLFVEGTPGAGPLFKTDSGAYYKTAYAPIFYEGEVVAAVGVEASAGYFQLLTRFASMMALLGVLGVGMLVLLGIWFSRLLVRPVNTLVEAAARLGRGELNTPVENYARSSWERTQELDVLMSAFEEMRQSIVERDQRMQMMLAGIAHEVRNPLGGMELFCGLLREDLQAGEGDGMADKVAMVERIEREIDYLEGVVSNFLDFARREELVLERIEGADLIGEVLEVVEIDATKVGCAVAAEVEDGVELTVDPGKLRRALINVLRNACQASADQGTAIVVRCRARDDRRILEVKDQGEGIAPDKIEELCKPFITTREKGSGLGLALTRHIVEEHGGELTIDSAVGRGTTVTIELPFDDSVEARETDNSETVVPEGWLG